MKNIHVKLSVVCVSLVVINLFLIGQSFSEIAPESIVATWLLDEGEGKAMGDYSENGHDGEFVGDIKWIDGQFGSALEFPGAAGNYVLIQPVDSLALPEFTITAWIKTEAIQGEGAIVTNMPANKPRNYNLRSHSDGMTVIVFTTSMNWTMTSGQTSVVDGTWHHVAGSYDGENARMYIDGNMEGEGELGPPDENPGPVTIGGTVQGHFFTGIIDDIGLFNTALAGDDIGNIMDKGLAAATGLTAVYPSDKLAVAWGSIKVLDR